MAMAARTTAVVSFAICFIFGVGCSWRGAVANGGCSWGGCVDKLPAVFGAPSSASHGLDERIRAFLAKRKKPKGRRL
jgi:hypothetical protein